MKQERSRKTVISRIGTLAMCLVLMMSALTMTTFADDDAKNVEVTLSPQTKIVVDGKAQTFYNVSGVQVHPISYNNSTYLPVRSICELIDKNIIWDQSKLTATIGGERTTSNVVGTPDTSATTKKITVQLRPDFTIMMDGVKREFKDAKGSNVYPLLNNGTIYLPLRATGELMGKTVGWDNKTNTATLTTGGNSGSLVTDVDGFGNSTDGNYIGVAKAKSIALNHAKLAEDKVTFAHAYLEKDDNRWEYDVEFYTSDYKEYDYEIDAITGAIISFDYDAEDYSRPSNSNTSTNSNIYIGEAKAREVALKRAGVTAGSISQYKCKLDSDDGRMIYEIEFKSGSYEYDLDINAVTGTVIEFDKDRD